MSLALPHICPRILALQRIFKNGGSMHAKLGSFRMITSIFFSIVVDECTPFDRRQDKPTICTHLDYGLLLGFILHDEKN